MKLRIFNFIIIMFIFSCSDEMDYEKVINVFEQKSVIFSKNIHIVYRGRDDYDNNLFTYYKENIGSLNANFIIKYKSSTNFEILDNHFPLIKIDSFKIKKQLDLLLNLNIKSLSIDSLNQIKLDLDEDEHMDLIKVINPTNLNDYQKMNYKLIKENWYLDKD